MYLFGASGHGKVIAEIAESNNVTIHGFIDTDHNKKSVLGYPVFHEMPLEPIKMIVAIGNNKTRKKIAEKNISVEYPVLKHAASWISKRALLKPGTVVMAGVSVNVDVKIGRHCIINTNVSVDHDCTIADYVHLSPNVALAGNVSVGEGSHIGIGACVIQGISIGKWCVIGAGSVIIRDIPDGCTVVGNPGRIIKKTNN